MSKAAKSKRAGTSAKAAKKRVSAARKAPSAGKGAAKKRPPTRPASYPPYLLLFKGQDEEEVQVEGPHTEFLSIGTPELGVKLEVSHNPTSTGPNLTIKISRS